MKTLKTTLKKSATKRLEKLNFNKNTVAYRFVERVISGSKEIRPCYTSGCKRFITNQDHTIDTCSILDKIGIDYELTNDSPKGGKTGNLISIKTKINQ